MITIRLLFKNIVKIIIRIVIRLLYRIVYRVCCPFVSTGSKGIKSNDKHHQNKHFSSDTFFLHFLSVLIAFGLTYACVLISFCLWIRREQRNGSTIYIRNFLIYIIRTGGWKA